jgi:uncharacterized protein (TIRG00374 family)
MSLLIHNLEKVNPYYIAISFICVILYYLCQSLNVANLLNAFGEKYSFFRSFNSTLIGAFYSSITPAASGGEPMQVYYMSKENIKVSHSSLALLIQLFCHLLSIVLLGIISAIFNSEVLDNKLLILFLIGLIFNSIVLGLYFIGIFSKKLTNKIIKIIKKILKFFKGNKADEINKKIDDELILFHESSSFIKKNKTEFVKAIIIAFLQTIINYSIPYFIYRSFGLNSYSIIYIISLQAILFCTVSCLPLPGTVGINETVFLILYSTVYSDNIIMNALLLQRGISFYIFVFINLIVVIINNIILAKKGLK